MLYKTGSPDTWHHLSPMVSVSRPDKILPECRVVRCQLSDTCATCLWSALCLLVTACALAAAGDVKVAFRNVSNEKKKTVEELIVKRKALNKQVLRFLVKKEHSLSYYIRRKNAKACQSKELTFCLINPIWSVILYQEKSTEINKDGEQNSIVLLVLCMPVTICVLKKRSTDTLKCLNITGRVEQELYINEDWRDFLFSFLASETGKNWRFIHLKVWISFVSCLDLQMLSCLKLEWSRLLIF